MTPEAYATLLKQIGTVEHEIDLQRIRCNHSVADAAVYTRETKLFWTRLHELGDLARDLASRVAEAELMLPGSDPRHRAPHLGSTPTPVATLSPKDGDSHD